MNKNSYQSLDLQRRVITDGVEIHSMINGIAAFQEQNGYLPEYGNKSHPKLVLKRGGEFTHLNANDLERCSTALDEFKESKDEDDLKLADVLASSTSLSFSPLINMVSGVTLGYIGQYIRAGAMVHGISKALVLFDENLKTTLKTEKLTTRDSRAVERKKPGRRKARRSFQFSKR